MRRSVVVALALAVATAARAQGEARRGSGSRERQVGGEAAAGAGGGSSDLFERACVDLLHGRTPQDEKAIQTLKDACADLMSAKADDRVEAAQRRKAQALAAERQREARVEPGRASGPVGAGEGVLAAFEQAGSELVGPDRMQSMGFRRSGGAVRSTLITNPVGWFNGLGMNAELFRSFEPRLSWVAGARYSNTDATNGTASTFGLLGGVDLFLLGRNNEGLRIGPRVELAAGRENFQGSTTFARLGMAGEVGYNFIASNGVTGLLAGGLGGRVAGDEKNQDFSSFVGGDFGPYLKFGLGYSW